MKRSGKRKGRKQTKAEKKAASERMKKLWADPKWRRKQLKKFRNRTYTKEGIQALRENGRLVSQSEGYKNMDRTRSKKSRKKTSEKIKALWAKGHYDDAFADDFEVIEVERPNDYSGVITEKDYAEM